MADRQVVGAYRLTAPVPPGRALEAYQAVDEAGKPVVVKLLAPLDREAFFAHLRRLAGLRHPNLARVLDWGTEGDLAYVVTEAFEGTDLASMTALGGPPAAAVVAELGAQAAAALAALHGKGIVHGGVTPLTLIRTADGTLKLTDAGIAAAGQADLADVDPPENAYFVSPEEVLARPVTARSDIYALGVSLYAVAVGCVPFDGPNALVVAQRQTGAAPDAPSSLRPDLPEPLERAILKAMAKQPEQRQASADGVRRELLRAASAKPPAAPPPAATADRPRTPIWPWVIGLVLVAIVAAAVWLPGALGNDGVTVPGVTGMTLDEARGALADAGLLVGALSPGELTVDTIQGTVLGQSPTAGQQVEAGTSVDLVVAGSGTITMPDVTGLPQTEAEAAVIAAGLSVERLLTVYSDTVPAGSVVAQSPAAGSTVPPGTGVTLSLSGGTAAPSGPGTMPVPDVVGATQADALESLDAANFTGVITTQMSDSVPAGQVISQSPQAAAVVQQGSSVTIVVSSGPATTTAP